MFWQQYWERAARGEIIISYRQKERSRNHWNNFWKAVGNGVEQFMKTGSWLWR